ncbi:response regulator [Pelagicoccus sp. SDUM812005]|uniref:response regulator n=1 Tax=Pelagicoccus sp. SDUM812005 TaxID=3041257 RepID=UPI00280ECA8E|nr:response regulator [Pelagicoccus sp. SDUM812005]MDQ8182925.1 response regulator [Pelagicoccus sp. SDUM812005]
MARTRFLLLGAGGVAIANAGWLASVVDSGLGRSLALALSIAGILLLWRVYSRLALVEQEVRAKEEQLNFVFDSVPIGLYWSYHREGESPRLEDRLFNPAHFQITGLTKEDMMNPGAFARITHPADLQAQRKVRAQLATDREKEVSMEKRYLRSDGELVWVKTTWKRLYDADGKGFKEINTIVDITEQKKVAAELEQSRIAAEEASRSKSLFLASMSHEIRTPMNGMIGMLHILESHLDEENLSYLKIAQNSANDLLALINDILDFSKIEAGKMEFKYRKVALDELLERGVEIHASNAFEKGLDLSVRIQPESLIEINTDPHKLRQALSNLVSNAIKFTERGSVVVGSRMDRSETGLERLEIYVQDTGIGLDAGSRDRLFHAFTQANESTTRKFGGTGLGLSICKSIVENLGGEIGVESELGNGSKFWIRFPLGDGEFNGELLQRDPELALPCVLVVDRSAETLDYLQSWLQHWGCPMVLAKSLDEARERLVDSEAIQAVFLDASLWRTDESKWTRMMEHEPKLAGARFTLLERLTSDDLRKMPDWASGKLNKPLRIRQLHAAVCARKVDTDQAESPDELASVRTIDFSGANVLVVEDNLTNRMIVTKLLKLKYCIDADTAENGLDALSLMRGNRYDMVLMDCMMPEMDGYEATRAIREGLAGEENRSIPIIALTANAMEEDQKECKAAGMDDHISKPVSIKEIQATLERWVGNDCN